MKGKPDFPEKVSLCARLYRGLIRETLFPLLIMVLTPNLILLLAHIIVVKNSNLTRVLFVDTIESTLTDAWKAVKWDDLECWSIVSGLILWGIISLHFPGRKYHGPPTPNGFRPEYWNSGFKYYLISMLIACPLIWKYSILHLYYKIPNLIAILIVFGFGFCVILYIKGLVFPDPGICDITKNIVFDYYWGVELYPHLGPFVSLKILINSRFGLFLWQLIALTAWKANYELYIASYNRGHINWPLTTTTLLVSIYLAKFYYSEDSYLHSMDASHDRFGYYLAWGCIAFVPGFYSLNSLYLVKHSPMDHFGLVSALIVLTLGSLFAYLTYCVDRQKLLTRQTNGKCDIWGKPVKVIRATYTDNYGITKRTVILMSGFWAVARHMNYTFELLFAAVMCCPALISSPIPYLRFAFVSVLIIHRTSRDQHKCWLKYGTQWDEYCKLVPYKMVPGLF